MTTTITAKYRIFVWFQPRKLADATLVAIARSDDATFGVLQSRFHEVWSLASCSWLGVGNDPRYTPGATFQTFPFPVGLTPADTSDQRVEILPEGAVIPGNWGQSANSPETLPASGQAKLDSDPKFPSAAHMSNMPVTPVGKARVAIHSEANHVGLRGANPTYRDTAVRIAQAAKRLNDLRENWLNPPEWTRKVPEVTPLGLDKSPYPDRIEPKPGLSEADHKALQKRTLTNLYNLKPAWLTMAHEQLDTAVAAAYGWPDYRADMSDDEILKRLLALNLARSACVSGNN
jgi:hypothetical protein